MRVFIGEIGVPEGKIKGAVGEIYSSVDEIHRLVLKI